MLLSACSEKDRSRNLEDIAANEDVLAFMKTFDGRGALTDSSAPATPENALASFRFPADIRVDLVLSEPEITQPVFMNFDHRGRLWVVQYNQYPYPEGLKVTAMDQHIRATFDKVPPPPGEGSRGADKITFFEDTDGDGTYDKSTDAITGLNIATSVALGRGQIWVLNPPYLLAYADADDNGLPDSRPVVHLEGFGLEDTHAVANNLRWGPDGWLYGAQGSTCTANVSSAVSKNVKFDGQVIWRYHPVTKIFEVFAEGGGNTFDVEIDAKGRVYSGDNGTSRGQYYKQGAYYPRNFGKHGALTNPFAFGFLPNMDLVGERVRFTHAFVKYEGENLPDRYAAKMVAVNPLQGYLQLSRFEANGSTFRVVDEERILETDDHWFRPVDITTGPDGGIYIVDWYDSRLSHVDPRDTWSKSNGRIYRIHGGKGSPQKMADISRLSGAELVGLLGHKNRWYRQQALRVLGDRRDAALIPKLKKLLETGTPQVALEALWAIHLSGGFDEAVFHSSITHADPFVRMWAVRLAGDKEEVSPQMSEAMINIAATESHAEVRSQLAATARRLPEQTGLSILKNLLTTADDAADPDIPLQIWWALESKLDSNQSAVLSWFNDPSTWSIKTVRQHLLQRLMQRLAMSGPSGLEACARLIGLAPSESEVRILLNGLQEGLRGGEMAELPPVLERAIDPYRKRLGEHSLAISLRQGSQEAVEKALAIILDQTSPVAERLHYVRIFGEVSLPACIPVLLDVVESNQSSPTLVQTALLALQRYEDKMIGKRITKAYPDRLRADPDVRLAALSLLATRPAWARDLVEAIGRKKLAGENFVAHTISKNDVPDHIVRQLQSLGDREVNRMVAQLWPDAGGETSAETSERISKVSAILASGKGAAAPGKKVFRNTCGPCHRLSGEGGTLGPDLTGYERRNTSELLTNILDPNAYVREGYGVYRMTTADGRILSGTISGREGTSVTIRLLSGEYITFAEKEILEMHEQPSMMPGNLLDNLTEEQIRDLFAYLAN